MTIYCKISDKMADRTRINRLALKRPTDPQSIQNHPSPSKSHFSPNAIDLNQIDANVANGICTIIHAKDLLRAPPSTYQKVDRLDDLDQTILVKIFQWLDFPDLLNAANATKKLRAAAVWIYTQNHTDKLVKFNGNSKDSHGIIETANTYEISDARTCLKMFRAFGDSIRSMRLDFNGIGPRRIRAISQTLVEYCANALTELEWHNCPTNAITAKFPQLTTLRMIDGHLAGPMSQFNKTFPALVRLELNRIEIENRKCIEQTFPHLTRLKVNIEPRSGLDFTKSNIKNAIKLNPQLNCLSIGSGCEPSLLAFFDEMLPFLSDLEIANPRRKFFDGNESAISFKRVTSFRLDIVNCKDSFTNIPFRFKRLKIFTLNARDQHRNKWIDFLVEHPKIVELNLLHHNWFYVLKKEPLMKIAALPKLTQLTLDWRIASPDNLIEFLDACNGLTKMRLAVSTPEDRNQICSKIGDTWNYFIDNHFIRLQRNESYVGELKREDYKPHKIEQ